VLGQETRRFARVFGADGVEDGLMFLDRAGETAAEIQRWGAVAAQTVEQAGVDRGEVGVVGALDEEEVKGGIGGEEGVDVAGRGVLAHLLLQAIEFLEVGGCHAGRGEADRQRLQRLTDAVSIEELLRREGTDDRALPWCQRHQTLGREPAERLADGNATDPELGRQVFFGQGCLGCAGIAEDALAQVLVDLLRQRRVIQFRGRAVEMLHGRPRGKGSVRNGSAVYCIPPNYQETRTLSTAS
jgi:hypothetical protein